MLLPQMLKAFGQRITTDLLSEKERIEGVKNTEEGVPASSDNKVLSLSFMLRAGAGHVAVNSGMNTFSSVVRWRRDAHSVLLLWRWRQIWDGICRRRDRSFCRCPAKGVSTRVVSAGAHSKTKGNQHEKNDRFHHVPTLT